jgi:hypothetical protein
MKFRIKTEESFNSMLQSTLISQEANSRSLSQVWSVAIKFAPSYSLRSGRHSTNTERILQLSHISRGEVNSFVATVQIGLKSDDVAGQLT